MAHDRHVSKQESAAPPRGSACSVLSRWPSPPPIRPRQPRRSLPPSCASCAPRPPSSPPCGAAADRRSVRRAALQVHDALPFSAADADDHLLLEHLLAREPRGSPARPPSFRHLAVPSADSRRRASINLTVLPPFQAAGARRDRRDARRAAAARFSPMRASRPPAARVSSPSSADAQKPRDFWRCRRSIHDDVPRGRRAHQFAPHVASSDVQRELGNKVSVLAGHFLLAALQVHGARRRNLSRSSRIDGEPRSSSMPSARRDHPECEVGPARTGSP